MNKLVAIVMVVIAIAAAATFFVYSNLDETIAELIETEGTAALGTQVSVEKVTTDLRAGSAVIDGFSVANVPGFKDASAIQIGSFVAEVDYANMAVKNINIDGATINAELIGKKNNFQELINNMPPSAEEAPEEESADEQVLEIQRLALVNTAVKLTVSEPALGERTFVMDDLVMTDLSGTADELSEEVARQLIGHVSGQITSYAGRELQKRAIKEVKDKVKEKLKEGLGDRLKDLGF